VHIAPGRACFQSWFPDQSVGISDSQNARRIRSPVFWRSALLFDLGWGDIRSILSTTMRMYTLPAELFGKGPKKSICTRSIGPPAWTDPSVARGFTLSLLRRPQFVHAPTCKAQSFAMPGQKYWVRSRRSIFSLLTCPAAGKSWWSCNSCGMCIRGTTTHQWKEGGDFPTPGCDLGCGGVNLEGAGERTSGHLHPDGSSLQPALLPLPLQNE
jgi:hypothetical protein